MENKTTTEIIKDFSPRMFFSGLEGIWNTGEYESVEVKITFNKHRAATVGAVDEQRITGQVQNAADTKE
jgi:hypothetical protein